MTSSSVFIAFMTQKVNGELSRSLQCSEMNRDIK